MRYDEYERGMDVSPAQLEPPGYPFPGEEIVFSSARNAPDFTLGEDSWFALAKMPDEQEHVFNGRKHTNPYRFTIHTPVRGSSSMFSNHGDLESLLLLSIAGMCEEGRYTDDDHDGKIQISEKWINGLLPDGYEVEFV